MKKRMIKLTIFGNPPTKKNSQQIVGTGKKKRIIQSDRYLEYEGMALWQLKGKGPKSPIQGPVNVKCIYYRKTRHRVDLVNLLNATLDILTRAKVIEDDNCKVVAGIDGSRVRYDKENPRVEIEITEEKGTLD